MSYTGSALTYDVENRITSTTQSGIGSMYYSYDGAGQRVQEVSTYNTEKVFVYDVFGHLSAEYSIGMPASPPCKTCYIATDHLGSTRMVTDKNASVVGRHDYLPFGEEIAANAGGRDSTFGTQDSVNVDKPGSRTFSCASGGTHLMAAVENNTGAFANNQSAVFASRFPDSPIKMGGTYSIYPGLNNGLGGMLPSGPLRTGSLDVRVTQISSSGWTFTTNPSQHYIDGSVSFSAANAGNGNVTFSIHAQGNFAGPISWALQPIIKADENSNWNNMLDSLQGFCQLSW